MKLRSPVFLLLVVLLTSCVPSVERSEPNPELARVAEVIYHRMAVTFYETGVYNTQTLLAVQLPRGAMWTITDFAEDGSTYELLLTSANEPDWEWRITPRGARRYAST